MAGFQTRRAAFGIVARKQVARRMQRRPDKAGFISMGQYSEERESRATPAPPQQAVAVIAAGDGAQAHRARLRAEQGVRACRGVRVRSAGPRADARRDALAKLDAGNENAGPCARRVAAGRPGRIGLVDPGVLAVQFRPSSCRQPSRPSRQRSTSAWPVSAPPPISAPQSQHAVTAGGGRHGAGFRAAKVDAMRQAEGACQRRQARIERVLAITRDHRGRQVAQRCAAAVHVHQRLYARQQLRFQRGRHAFGVAARGDRGRPG